MTGEECDKIAIKIVRGRHGDQPSQESAANDLHNLFSIPSRFWELVHINELIWWCMNKQREYDRCLDDRQHIALITATLNDVRDSIKTELGEKAKLYQ